MNNRFKFLTAIIVAVQFAALPICRGDLDIPSELKGVCIYHPEPNWWGMARKGMHGRVVVQLSVDPKTGTVTEVKVLRKTLFSALNAEIIMTAFNWRFRPGSVTQVKVPFELILRGYFKEIH